LLSIVRKLRYVRLAPPDDSSRRGPISLHNAIDDLDQVIEQYQRAANEFLKGNPEPHKMMFSHRGDATLLNPFGSLDHGFEQVAETMERFASQISDGEVTSFDVLEKYVTPELACVV
jgi:hypothetical protein